MDEARRPLLCVVRIRGHLGATLLAGFPDLDAVRRDGETVLVGVLPDQAALFGVIAQIEALALELLEVRSDPTSTAVSQQREALGRTPSG